jgi:hypothetical protein
VAKKRLSLQAYFSKEMEQIMSSLKDPYEVINWNPNCERNALPDVGYEGERGWGIYTGNMKSQRIGQLYDLISLCTLAAALATFFRLLFNW